MELYEKVRLLSVKQTSFWSKYSYIERRLCKEYDPNNLSFNHLLSTEQREQLNSAAQEVKDVLLDILKD